MVELVLWRWEPVFLFDNFTRVKEPFWQRLCHRLERLSSRRLHPNSNSQLFKWWLVKKPLEIDFKANIIHWRNPFTQSGYGGLWNSRAFLLIPTSLLLLLLLFVFSIRLNYPLISPSTLHLLDTERKPRTFSKHFDMALLSCKCFKNYFCCSFGWR